MRRNRYSLMSDTCARLERIWRGHDHLHGHALSASGLESSAPEAGGPGPCGRHGDGLGPSHSTSAQFFSAQKIFFRHKDES